MHRAWQLIPYHSGELLAQASIFKVAQLHLFLQQHLLIRQPLGCYLCSSESQGQGLVVLLEGDLNDRRVV